MYEEQDTRKWVLRKVRRMTALIREDKSLSALRLNKLVRETAADKAEEINKSGIQSQLDYLLRHGWTEETIKERLH